MVISSNNGCNAPLFQYVAEIGYDMVTPTRTPRAPPRYRLRHPADFREGIVNAYTVITEVS